jgi:hypothetical protein
VNEAPSVEKSITEQIIDETLARVSASAAFDAASVDRLRRLVASGNIGKPAQVLKAIKGSTGAAK